MPRFAQRLAVIFFKVAERCCFRCLSDLWEERPASRRYLSTIFGDVQKTIKDISV